MADLLPPSYCWHCLHYLEWTTIAVIWDNSGVGHNTVPDFLMTTMATATGIGYNSPPPLDWVWTTSKPMWFEIGDQYEAEGDADWNLCEPFIGAWFKGAGWPDLG
jgi:hypothetical protein